MSDRSWQHWGTDSWMLCFLHQGKNKPREMSELPFGCLPHSGQSLLQPRSVVHWGPGPEQPGGGHWSRRNTLGLRKLPIYRLRGNWSSVRVPCPDDGSGCASARGASMKELWTKTFSLLLPDYLKSRVQIFGDKTQTLKIEISSIYSNILKISFTTILHNVKTWKRGKYWSCVMNW